MIRKQVADTALQSKQDIKQINAALFYNEGATSASGYIRINNGKENLVFTFRGGDQINGIIPSSRCKIQHTTTMINDVKAELELPDENADYTNWRIGVTFPGQERIDITLKPTTKPSEKDGKFPVADGVWYRAEATTFSQWFSEVNNQED
jgi:hypothetical protein